MELGLFVRLKCKSVAFSGGLKRFIKRSVYRWVKDRSFEPKHGKVEFEVTFERSRSHRVDCYTRIASHMGDWFTHGSGKSPQEAFKKCLGSL